MTKTNWINTYSGNSRAPQKFQAGGPMGAEAPAPAPEQGGGPQGPDLEGMLSEYAQSRDPQLAVAICDTLVQMMAQQGGGGAEGGAPAGPEAGAPPMARRGMRMSSAPIF